MIDRIPTQKGVPLGKKGWPVWQREFSVHRLSTSDKLMAATYQPNLISTPEDLIVPYCSFSLAPAALHPQIHSGRSHSRETWLCIAINVKICWPQHSKNSLRICKPHWIPLNESKDCNLSKFLTLPHDFLMEDLQLKFHSKLNLKLLSAWLSGSIWSHFAG